MGNKPVISKQQILDAAYDIARTKGLSGLSIREVARACDVAVGTVYHSYPTKSDLVNDVVGRFWNESLADRMPLAASGTDFVEFCRELAAETSRAFARFRSDWLAEVSALNAHDLAAAHRREEATFSHIRRGLMMALDRDPRIDRARLTGPLAPEPLSAFVWTSMLTSVKRGEPSCETLLALLRTTLY
ncbi:TetR/AcrR family transcriptional regulator [Arabiibacter massiliensis]|uniref:TetR/AcrR family transcriptional regulator n=1 Tax=Arabiibacter massiliensis TaxID=1870985 RepID=UPI0009BB6EFE|nr:TetR/AcrR family transcriptional regulator [Arabiibacter massiliensis]